jgi:4-hydroxybenzoate polyprenyltransferase
MSRVFRVLGCVRIGEVLLLQGAPVIGLVLAPGTPSPVPWTTYLLFVAASVLLVAHVWTLNDWADADLDALDGNKSSQSFVRNGLTRSTIGGLSATLLLLSLGLFSLLGTRALEIAVGIAALGGVYSAPGVRAKGIVVLSSVLHLSGGALHFLLGYTLFAPADYHAIPLALFFALTFTAGHCVQEVQDQETDRLAGVRTNSVVFGKRPMFCIGVVLFVTAYIDLMYIGTHGFTVLRFDLLLIPLLFLHLVYAHQALTLGLSFHDVYRFRKRYRAIMMAAGVLICL